MYNEAGDFHTDLKTDGEIRRIAAKNGYSFNSSHHDNEEIGMPWVIDFYIEAAISKKRLLNRPVQLKMEKLKQKGIN